MVYIRGYDPMLCFEALLNLLIQKGIITKAEAEAVLSKGKAPGS